MGVLGRGVGSRPPPPPPPTQDLWWNLPLIFTRTVQSTCSYEQYLINFKARTVTESVSLGEISLIVGTIKDYVIVTIVYLNAFYREKGQMIGYTLIIQ